MKKILSVTLLIALTGCSTQTYLVSSQQGNAQPSYDKMQTFFVSGIGQEQEVNASDICESNLNVTKVENKQTFLNGLLHTITYGIYSPRQARIYCK